MRNEFFRQKLVNWGRWMRSRESGALGYGRSPLANLMGRSQSADYESTVPVIEVEASRTDEAVRSMLPELQRVARCWWVHEMTVRDAAAHLHCSTTTVQKRVDQVVQALSIWSAERAEERPATRL